MHVDSQTFRVASPLGFSKNEKLRPGSSEASLHRVISATYPLQQGEACRGLDLGVDLLNQDYRKHHELAGMQDPGLCCSFRISLQIARLLVDKQGKFREEKIPFILQQLDEQFCKTKENIPPFVTTLKKNLEIFRCPQQKEKILSIFNEVSIPTNSKAAFRCELLIRATLVHPQEKPLDDRDARIVFLKYLLDEPRQGDTGTCYAEWL